jgi:uracil-DNA glycosylase
MSRFRLERPAACLTCSLNSVAQGFSEPEGFCTNGVLAIGESLGWNEAVDGYPFRVYAQAGNALERAFKKAGYDRKQFGMWNICGCRPPDDSLKGWESAMQHCRVHFRRVFARYKPRVILALGAVPLRSLTGLAGYKLNLESIRGYPLWCEEFGVWVVGTYHPSHLARGAWNLMDVLVRDIRKAVTWARDGVPVQQFNAVEDGTEDQADRMLEELQDCPELPLSLDIEDNSLILKQAKIKDKPEVTQINLAVSERRGLVVQPTVRNMQTFKRMCFLPNPKIGQNLFLYDIPELEENYGFVFNGIIEDVMWRFHHLYPDLPQKKSKKDEDDEASGVEVDTSELTSIAPLQYIASFADFPFPWKHYTNTRPGFYGVCDVIAPLMAYWWMRERMEKLGIEEGYQRLNVEFWDCLRSMRIRGIPINAKVLTDLHVYLSGVVNEEESKIPALVPDVCRPLKQKGGLKKEPKDTTGYVQRTFNIKANPNVKCKCFRVRRPTAKDQGGFEFLSFMESEYAITDEKTGKVRAPDPNCPVCDGVGAYSVEAHKEVRWCQLLPFNVGSGDQMWDYARYKKYKVPQNAKKKYAMDQETIARLLKSTGDPLYAACDRIRRFNKLDSTYALGWLNAIKFDGCVHPQIADFTSIKQLGSRNPNSQNVPSEAKNPELAPMFRKGIEAPDGRVGYEADFKGFHNQTLGYEAARCMNVATLSPFLRLAKIDIHTYFAVNLLKVPGYEKCLTWDDKELATWLKWQRQNYKMPNGAVLDQFRNAKAKHALHGYGNGLKGPGLYRRYPDNFRDVKEAEWVVSMLDDTFPEVAEFHKWMPLATKGGVRIDECGTRRIVLDDGEEVTDAAITRYGCIRWFFNVKRYDFKNKRVVHGEDWERAMCYPHTNDAHCHIRLVMMRLDAMGAAEKFWMGNQVHDALWFFPLKKDLEECHHIVATEMARASEIMLMPWDGMKGLSVEVDAKWGKNFAEMEKI